MTKKKKKIDNYHRHEALHMASVIMNLVEQQLIQAPAIKADKDWSARADQIHQNLFDLYNAIGFDHLDGEESQAETKGRNRPRNLA